MNNIGLAEMITYSTVQIHCIYNNGSKGSGTGFIINLCPNEEKHKCIPVLITNNHVVNNSVKTEFEFCKKDDNGNPIDREAVRFELVGNSWIKHPDSQIDLCCLLLAPIFSEIQNNGLKIFYIPLGTSLIPSKEQLGKLSALEELVMVGYPIGIYDSFNHKPVLRKGITATHLKNDYQGNKEFLIDMACFPGSSGSPVFIFNQGSFTTNNDIVMGSRLYLVGVLYGGPQYTAVGTLHFANLPNTPTPITQIPTNLGIAIKSEKILDFENIFPKI